jgi:hypothetical protein
VLVVPPQHGTICYRLESSPIRYNSDPDRKYCVGKSVISKVLYYRSDDKYVGSDSFEYDAVFMSGISSVVDTRLSIIPANHPHADGPDSPAIPKSQAGEQALKCVEPLS